MQALIGMARKLRAAQPRLWDYAYDLRDKKKAAALLDIANMTPLLHISGKYPAARGCAALVLPLARHPRMESRVIVFDLDSDPTDLIELGPGDIADRLYTPAADLPEGESRVALKEVHTNKCPVLVPLAHLRDDDFVRMGIDRAACLANAERLRAQPGLGEKVRQVFAAEVARSPADPDAALYDGFPTDADKRMFPKVRSTPAAQLPALEAGFSDPRYRELLFRYRARNWPESLDDAGLARWNDYRRLRLDGDRGLSEHDFTQYYAEIARLRADQGPGPAQAVLDALDAWGHDIETSL